MSISIDRCKTVNVCVSEGSAKSSWFFIRFNKAGTTQNEDRKGHANE